MLRFAFIVKLPIVATVPFAPKMDERATMQVEHKVAIE